MNPHEKISIPKLLVLAGLCVDEAQGISAVVKGKVYVEHWNIGVAEVSLPRWVLRGVRITVGDRSFLISEDGERIERNPNRRLELA